MRDLPKWLIALAGTGLLPLLAAPFYLLGIVKPFGTSDYAVLRFLLFVLSNLIWLSPVILFFVALDYYRRGFHRTGIVAAIAGLLLTVTAFALLV